MLDRCANAKERCRRRRYFPAINLNVLVQQYDVISRSDGPFNEHDAVEASFAVVSLCHPSQDFWSRVCRVGIERDHLAPRVTVHHRYDRLSAYLEPATYQRILSEPAHGLEAGVYVCPKAPLVQG